MTGLQWLAWGFKSVTGYQFRKDIKREAGETYMIRWHLLKTRIFSIYVHKILTPDYDQLLHTHPWLASWSLRLSRRPYREQLPGGVFRFPPRFHRIPFEHRITDLPEDKPVWTLFIGWKSSKNWGFVANDGAIIPSQVRKQHRGLE